MLLGTQRSGSNRQWVNRANSNPQYRVSHTLGLGDALDELDVSKTARAKDPPLPAAMRARAVRYQRPGEEPQTLLTSLTDRRQYPAGEVELLYHERWELELGYGEAKTDMLQGLECIRCKSPELVKQELWGIFLTYNLVRLEMDRVARELKLEPTKISFVAALRLIRDEWMWSNLASPGAIPRHLLNLRARDRGLPGAVKPKMSEEA